MTYPDQVLKEIYFKHITTAETKMYMVNALWTIKQFMIIINHKIAEDFNVDAFELVESDHLETLLESDELLCHRFGNELNVAFYIRPIPVTTDCIICYSMLPNVTHYFACSHVICHACMGEWSRHICPICRR